MTTRRHALLLAATAVVAAAVAASVSTAAFAAGLLPFGTANFVAARSKGPVALHINATWCPTCRAQKPILAKLLAEPRFKGVTAYTVDYDAEKPTLRELNAQDRSTILVFVKGEEVARSTGDTSEDKIAAVLEKAL